MYKYFSLLMVSSLLAGCGVTTQKWQATQHYDEFTETKVCRVMRGSQNQRDFKRGFMGQAYGVYFTKLFYVENHNGEVRAGIRTEPPMPIGGDVQIKVGSKLYTLTVADTPLDAAPTMPAMPDVGQNALGEDYANNIKDMTSNIQKLSSPYRAYTGEKALQLLRDVVQTQGEIKYRVIGVNQAASSTGTFSVDDDFRAALTACGISL